MNGRKPFTLITAVIFLVVALLHVYRLLTHFHVVLGSHDIPLWVSYGAILVAGGLALGLFRESRR